MSLWKLFAALAAGSEIEFLSSGNVRYKGIIQSIQREDGSGKCWNITVTDREWGTVTTFVKAE